MCSPPLISVSCSGRWGWHHLELEWGLKEITDIEGTESHQGVLSHAIIIASVAFIHGVCSSPRRLLRPLHLKERGTITQYCFDGLFIIFSDKRSSTHPSRDWVFPGLLRPWRWEVGWGIRMHLKMLQSKLLPIWSRKRLFWCTKYSDHCFFFPFSSICTCLAFDVAYTLKTHY